MIRVTRLSLSSLKRALVPAVVSASLLWLSAARAEAQTTGDPYPQNTIAFFNAACPSGWSPYSDGVGRTVVAVAVADGVGHQVLGPLASGANPTHTHSFSSSIEVKRVSYVGSTGGGNENLAHSGKKDFSGTTNESSINVPYLQLMVCVKTDAVPGAGVVPGGITAFFRDLSCPTGWANLPTAMNGRFLVGLPQNGSVQAHFGGRPLQSQENREHQHQFSGSVKTNSHGIAGNSGCCAEGYAKNGTYEYNRPDSASNSRSTGPGKANLPYIQLMQCRKQ
jgi:hypothetical protein